MSQSINPLRIVADNQYGVDGGSANLVANGIYSVEDILNPVLTSAGVIGDPRIFFSYGNRRTRLRWRKVNQDGWISPKRKAQGDKDTVIQIKFARPRRFNRISFELLRVPQNFHVRYFDSTRKRMVRLSDSEGRKVEGTLGGFKANVTSPGSDKNNTHKWREYKYKLPTIKSNLIEIHMNRNLGDSSDLFGLDRNSPYALGIRNIRVKMRVTDDQDNDDEGTPTPIGTTERPVIFRHSSVMAHDSNDYTYWECAPQGAANSVVPFYVDVRQDDGTASTFDQLQITPLWTGPSMNVYYSSDDTTTPWVLSPNKAELTRIGSGSFAPATGLSVASAGDGWSISNDYLKFDLTRGFMTGMLFTPTNTNAPSNDRYLLLFQRSGQQFALRFSPSSTSAGDMTGTFKAIRVAGGTTTLYTSSSYTLINGTQYGIVFGYTPNSTDPTSTPGWHIAVSAQPSTSSSIVEEYDSTTNLSGFFPTSMTIGENSTLDRPAQGNFKSIWVRQDPWSSQAASAFLRAPETFITGQGDHGQRVNGWYSGVFAGRFSSDLSANVGPGAGYYSNKVWTPVPSEYVLQTTRYPLPITTGKYLKLEFTGLIPRIYLTDEEVLPVRSFPQSVRNAITSRPQQTSTTPYALATGRELFEAVPALSSPGDPRILPSVRDNLEAGGVNGLPTIIYHTDMGSTNLATNPQNFDGSTQLAEIEAGATSLRFYRQGRHQYETSYVTVDHRAFFVGIKELSVYRTDQSVQFDAREYIDTYDDNLNVVSTTGWINNGGVYSAQSSGVYLTSKTMKSFSNFQTAQVAALDSGWESGLTDAQIDLETLTHVQDPAMNAFDVNNNTSTTHFNVVTGQYQGARGGNVIKLTRISGSTAEYGIRTAIGSYAGTLTESGARTTAAVRMQLPDTNDGTYELRIYAFDGLLSMTRRLVAVKPITIPIKAWKEIELGYIAGDGDIDFQVAIVQTNPAVSEAFVVDMIGLWQNPVRWDISNDNGTTYQPLLWPLNKATGYVRFKAADYRLKVRAQALRKSVVVSGWTVVPWYIESPMVIRAPIDYHPPWGQSDDQDFLDPSHKPIFQIWNHLFPQRFSTDLYGLY